MYRVRSVSGHVSPVRYLKPAPLGSRSITRVRHYYGRLRLPTASVSVLAVQACRDVRFVPRRRWDLLGYCLFSLSGSRRPAIPGGRDSLTLSWVVLLPAGVLIPSALSYATISGLNTFTVSFIRYHCSSPAFVPTHQVYCYQYSCKARYPARG